MATIYLSTTSGDDSRTYTQAQAGMSTSWATMAKVHSTGVSGDTVLMDGTVASPQTYTLPADSSLAKSFSWDSYIGDARAVLIDGAASGALEWRNSASITTTFLKVTLKNFAPNGISTFRANASNWTLIWTGTFFRDWVITSSFSSGGIWSGFTSTGCSGAFTNCQFYDCSLSGSGGHNTFLCTHQVSASLSVVNCTFDFAATGTNQFNNLATTNAGTLTSTWKNNVFYNTGSAIPAVAGGTPTFTSNYYSTGAFTSVPSGTGNTVLPGDPFVDRSLHDYTPSTSASGLLLMNGGTLT